MKSLSIHRDRGAVLGLRHANRIVCGARAAHKTNARKTFLFVNYLFKCPNTSGIVLSNPKQSRDRNNFQSMAKGLETPFFAGCADSDEDCNISFFLEQIDLREHQEWKNGPIFEKPVFFAFRLQERRVLCL